MTVGNKGFKYRRISIRTRDHPPSSMAPGALIDEPVNTPAVRSKNYDAPRDIFPDGIRTSGQHPPVYDQLKPYSEFPKEITGPTLWRKEDYVNNPEKWIHPFTDEEIQELSDTADRFIAAGTPLTGITKVGGLHKLSRPNSPR